jgi:hypothetical protein
MFEPAMKFILLPIISIFPYWIKCEVSIIHITSLNSIFNNHINLLDPMYTQFGSNFSQNLILFWTIIYFKLPVSFPIVVNHVVD